jgi:hypothetical protein
MPLAIRVFSPLVNLVVAVALCHGVVLVAVDRVAELILLSTDLVLLIPGQIAPIRRAIIGNFRVELRFLLFQSRGFTGGQLAARYARCNPILLILSARLDLGSRRCLSPDAATIVLRAHCIIVSLP